jgi:hypothetical protein
MTPSKPWQLFLFQIVHEQVGFGGEVICAFGVAGVERLLRLIEEVANLANLFLLGGSATVGWECGEFA